LALLPISVHADPPQPITAGTVVAPLAGRPIDFFLYHNKILFRALIEGRDATVLLDSGADFSVLDARFAAAAGLKGGRPGTMAGTSGNIATQVIPRINMVIPGRFSATLPVLAADLGPASKMMGQKMDLILGGDILRKRAVSINFGERQFRLLPSGFTPINFTRIPVYASRFAPLVAVQAGGEKLMAQIDFGSGGDLRISPEAWARIKPAGARATDAISSGANGRLLIESRARLPHLQIGDFDEQQADVRIAPMPTHLAGRADAILGLGVLARYDLVLDIGAGNLWLRPRASLVPRRVERTGLALVPDGPAAKIIHVSAGSPADRAGWKAGERICRINDGKVDVQNSDGYSWAYGAEGSVLAIDLCSGEKRRLTLQSYY
jgi:hypothetical protein